MGRLVVYNFISLNGYFKGAKEDISWAKPGSKEETDFAADNFKSGNILLFGRVTYEMMKSYWPTPEAAKNAPAVAEGMNKAEKIVFSKTLKNADPITIGWNNTRIINDNIDDEIKKLKQSPDNNMTILGSGSIVNHFAEKGWIDEYEIMVHPVAIEEGTPFLKDIGHKLNLELVSTRSFKSGVVLLIYQPVK
jgi:dihydrofolate reductase